MKLVIILLLCISSPIKCMWFEDYFSGPMPYAHPPLPAYPIILKTKEERKASKERENKDLMQQAHQMVAQHKDLSKPMGVYGFSSETLLTAAVGHKFHQNIIEFALSHGADPNAPDKAGNTPLKKAVTSKCSSNVIYLLGHGAKLGDQKLVNIVCHPVWDEIAPNSTRKRVATLKALLEGGADPNEIDLNYPNYAPCLLGYLLCHFLVRVKFASKGPEFQERYNCFLDQRKQMISILLNAGLNPFKNDEKGKSDWEKILELKDTYDSQLFAFTQEEIQKRRSL